MRRLILILFYIMPAFAGILAQNNSVSGRLDELFSLLPVDCKKNMAKAGVSNCSCQINNTDLSVKFNFNSNGKINHLGIDLFSFDINLVYPNSVLSFLERTFLEYFVWKNTADIERRNKEDKILLYMNDNLFGQSSFRNIQDILKVLNSDFSFNINQDGLFYKAVFSYESNNLSLYFPANYQIISGLDKKEYALSVIDGLKNMKSENLKISENFYPGNLLAYRDNNIFVSQGDAYFQTITSSRYYKKNNDKYSLLFSSEYPLESFSNIFLEPSAAGKKISLNIDHKLYGYETQSYNLTVADFLSYFADGFEFYFGVEDNTDEMMAGTLIMFSRDMNFINLLYVKTLKAQFFSDNAKVTAKFYTNIPADNIKNLFAEFDNTIKPRY
jgi:hypothetical protein